jgi:hypothetical protein
VELLLALCSSTVPELLKLGLAELLLLPDTEEAGAALAELLLQALTALTVAEMLPEGRGLCDQEAVMDGL